MNRKCTPHRWDYENWLPIIQGSNIDLEPLRCMNCGRELYSKQTSLNMRASIAHGIASRLYGGDEYNEVYQAVGDYFMHHLQKE